MKEKKCLNQWTRAQIRANGKEEEKKKKGQRKEKNKKNILFGTQFNKRVMFQAKKRWKGSISRKERRKTAQRGNTEENINEIVNMLTLFATLDKQNVYPVFVSENLQYEEVMKIQSTIPIGDLVS